MTRQTLIGKYNLTKYISPPKKPRGATTELEELIFTEAVGIEVIARRLLSQRIAQQNYRKIDPVFLNMHGNQVCEMEIKHPKATMRIQTPRFAVYNINNPSCEIFGRLYGNETYFPDLCVMAKVRTPIAPILEDGLIKAVDIVIAQQQENIHSRPVEKIKYPEVFSYYDSIFRFEIEWMLKSKFVGLLPSSVKETIRKNRRFFMDDMYVIAEAQRWACEVSEPVRLNRDPLLVGVLGDNCYLLDEFNCTPIEDYVRREFTT